MYPIYQSLTLVPYEGAITLIKELEIKIHTQVLQSKTKKNTIQSYVCLYFIPRCRYKPAFKLYKIQYNMYITALHNIHVL